MIYPLDSSWFSECKGQLALVHCECKSVLCACKDQLALVNWLRSGPSSDPQGKENVPVSAYIVVVFKPQPLPSSFCRCLGWWWWGVKFTVFAVFSWFTMNCWDFPQKESVVFPSGTGVITTQNI